MFQAGAVEMAKRAAAIAPSNPQRDGMRYMRGLRFGLVVMGTMRPPRTTWGINAIGVSAIAASAEPTSAEIPRPKAVAFIESAIRFTSSKTNALGPPLKPSAKKTIANSIVHCATQKPLRRTYLERT